MPGESSVIVRLRLLGANTFAAGTDRAAVGMERLGAASTGAAAKVRGVAASTGGVLRGVARFGKGVALVGGVVGFEAGKMAMNFQQAMLMIHTQAGASAGEVKKLSGEVLNLAHTSAMQSPEELANALYRLEGAGMRGAKAMSALKAASDLAAVGNANVEDTAKVLSQVWFSGIKGAGNMRKVVAEMNATVGAGDMRLQQLVDALGTGIMPVAKNAGLRMRDVTAAIAVFGDETNNVSGFTAQMATALHYLYAPGKKAAAAMSTIGLSGSDLGKDFRKKNGLLTALTDLRGHLNKLPGGFRGLKAAQVLSDILPGGRGRIMNIMLGQLDRYKKKIGQIGGTTGRFGEAVRKTQETAAFKVKHAWASIQASMVQLGGHILPFAASAFSHFAGIVAKASGALERFGRSKVGGAVKDFASTLTHGAPKPTALPRAKVGAHEEGGLGARRVRAAHEEGGLHVAPPMSKPPPMTGVQKAGLAVRNAIGGVMSWLGRVLPKAGAMLLGLGKQLIQAFKPAMPFFTNVLIPLLKGVAIGVIGAFIGAIKGIIFVVKILAPVLGFLGRVLRPLKGVFQAIGTVIGFVFAGAITKILGLLPKVGGVFRLMGAPIRLIGHLIGGAARIVGRLVSWFVKAHLWALRIAGTIPGAFGRVAKGVGNFVGGVINRIEALVGKIRGLGGKMVAAGGHLIRSIWTGMKNVFKSGLGFAADIGRALANWLNDHTPLGDKVHIGMPWPSPDINFRLPKLATGGHILSGGMAIVGERGPELVNLPGGSTVFDNRTSRRAAASMAGGGAIYVTANLHLSGRQIHSEVFRVDRHIAEMA
jgi:TP901 family phage tail tape measure protein